MYKETSRILNILTNLVLTKLPNSIYSWRKLKMKTQDESRRMIKNKEEILIINIDRRNGLYRAIDKPWHVRWFQVTKCMERWSINNQALPACRYITFSMLIVRKICVHTSRYFSDTTNLDFCSLIERIVHRMLESRVGQKQRMIGQPKRFTHDPEDDLTIFCCNDVTQSTLQLA